MKKQIPRSLHYGCFAFSLIGILPFFIVVYGLFVIAQNNAMTPKHLLLLLYCSVNLGFVAVLIATMRRGRRWSMLTTSTLLTFSLCSDCLHIYHNLSTNQTKFLHIMLFWLPFHLLTITLILAPSSLRFFSRNKQSKELTLFLKALGLLCDHTAA